MLFFNGFIACVSRYYDQVWANLPVDGRPIQLLSHLLVFIECFFSLMIQCPHSLPFVSWKLPLWRSWFSSSLCECDQITSKCKRPVPELLHHHVCTPHVVVVCGDKESVHVHE